MKKYKDLILTDDYNFLRENENLKDRIILLTLGGSLAYGTNNEDSDVDIRGIALERPQELIGFQKFEQVIDLETDTTIYAFNKIVGLLLNSNPNTIEMLGGKEEDYIYLSKSGSDLVKNRSLFLSQRVTKSFAGYAYQQLMRLENSLARHRVGQSKKEEHILNSIKSAMLSFDTRYKTFDENSIKLYLSDSDKADFDKEIKMDILLQNYPLRDINGILQEMLNIERLYGKINHRNKKKDDNHLDKHAMHLVRLYLMAIDLLEKEEIVTYRVNDLDLLRGIRGGKYRLEDGTYDPSFFDMLNEYRKRFEYAAKHTNLPLEPKTNEVEEFVMDVNTKIIQGGL